MYRGGVCLGKMTSYAYPAEFGDQVEAAEPSFGQRQHRFLLRGLCWIRSEPNRALDPEQRGAPRRAHGTHESIRRPFLGSDELEGV